MQTFQFTRPGDVAEAIAATGTARTEQPGAKIRFIAGGTTLIDLMKLNVEQPDTLVDINHLPLAQVESLPEGGLKIGALVRNSDLAHHSVFQDRIRISDFFETIQLRDHCIEFCKYTRMLRFELAPDF